MNRRIKLSLNSPEVKYLFEKDKRLQKTIKMVGPIEYIPCSNGYKFLVHEIILQMLSIKVGAKIYSRLESLCSNDISPNIINNLSDGNLKSIGISSNKIKYIRCFTDAILNNSLNLDNLDHLSDKEVLDVLTQINGIGNWTAKMYLIFVLTRPDVLPYEDVAFLQTYKWMYKTEDISPSSVQKKCKKWQPYSSIAARFMYRALDLGYTKEEFHLRK